MYDAVSGLPTTFGIEVAIALMALAAIILLLAGGRVIVADWLQNLKAGNDAKRDGKPVVTYGPTELFKLTIGGDDSPDSQACLVVEMSGGDIVAVTFAGQGLPFDVKRNVPKARVEFWKSWYNKLRAGQVTEVRGLRPKSAQTRPNA